jgi:hydrogenase expression/formation protein HypE
MLLDEASISISEEVKDACEILGLDPLYVANEGKLIAIVGSHEVDLAQSVLKSRSLGEGAAVIGRLSPNIPE